MGAMVSPKLNFDATEPPLLPAARLLRLRPAPFGRPFAPRLAAVPAAPLCYSGSVSPASARDRQDPLVARAWQDPVVADRQDPRAAGGPAPEAPLLPAADLVLGRHSCGDAEAGGFQAPSLLQLPALLHFAACP